MSLLCTINVDDIKFQCNLIKGIELSHVEGYDFFGTHKRLIFLNTLWLPLGEFVISCPIFDSFKAETIIFLCI